MQEITSLGQEMSCSRNVREISKLMGIEILGFQIENTRCQCFVADRLLLTTRGETRERFIRDIRILVINSIGFIKS